MRMPEVNKNIPRANAKPYKLAIVGATGNVGRAFLEILEERRFPVGDIALLASPRSAGNILTFQGKDYKVEDLEDYDFQGTHIALMAASGAIAAKWAPRIAQTGCVVIDNSSHFRMNKDIPLVVPEVNRDSLAAYSKRNIIANPNCSTAQLVVALKPLHDAATITRVVVSTYQSVSGAGKSAMDALFEQSRSLFTQHAGQQESEVAAEDSKPFAFNVIPSIDVAMEDGSCKEEWKMVHEVKKIMGKDIKLTATCVRVPVFVGHSESVNIAFKKPLSVNDARALLDKAEGCRVVDDLPQGVFTTPMDCVGHDEVFISRMRADTTVPHGLNLWVVSDNLRKGAALNAVQIAENLVAHYMKKAA